jgi:hypothetical protein
MTRRTETSALSIAALIFRFAVIIVFALALSAALTMALRAARQNVATARCNDGTFSLSLHANDTCSYHGGVGTWLNHPHAHSV